MKTKPNRRTFLLGSGAAAFAVTWRVAHALPSAEAWDRAKDIVRNIKAPKFPARDFDIRKYGAVPDGKTLATSAIAKAIDACAAAGGGRVVVPGGSEPGGLTFLTGAVHLKSNVNLRVEEGAAISEGRDAEGVRPDAHGQGVRRPGRLPPDTQVIQP